MVPFIANSSHWLTDHVDSIASKVYEVPAMFLSSSFCFMQVDGVRGAWEESM